MQDECSSRRSSSYAQGPTSKNVQMQTGSEIQGKEGGWVIDVFEAFAGYGGGSFALGKANIPHRLIGYSEIDKWASKCYEQNHGDVPAYGDITKINWNDVPDFDLLLGGFPCQDISIAGKQDLNKGRSILVFDLIKALKIRQPKYFLFENVSAIEQEKFKEFLRSAENGMRDAGYKVYRREMNSKDFGIPQSRSRIWFIGYRKDIASTFGFSPYPTETGCKSILMDLLDDEVPEKYYLSKDATELLFRNDRRLKETLCNVNGNSLTLLARDYKDPKCIELTSNQSQGARVYNPNGLAISINSNGGGMGAKTGLYAVLTPNRESKRQNGRRFKESGEPMFTLTGQDIHGISDGKIIRKLTPTECFRLMGFSDGEINLDGFSDTQKYRLAGNGWDVNLVSKIFKSMKMQIKEAEGI